MFSCVRHGWHGEAGCSVSQPQELPANRYVKWPNVISVAHSMPLFIGTEIWIPAWLSSCMLHAMSAVTPQPESLLCPSASTFRLEH